LSCRDAWHRAALRARRRGAASTSTCAAGRQISGPTEEAVREFITALELARLRRARWPHDIDEAMSVLGRMFPSLRGAPGVDPWDVARLVEWLNGPAPGSGARWAGRFLLGVWNADTDWTELDLEPPGRFDLFRAMSAWDDAHVSAMKAWIEAPFWP
jgi:hypothetical protein